MADENIYNTFTQTLYKIGSPIYQGDGNPLSDVSNIPQSNIGSGYATGETEMVYGTLQSGTFETGVQGWQIDAEGNAEFNNGTFRGTFIIGGTLITVSDIANLASAITTVSGLGGGTVSLVPNTYSATQSYSIPSNVTIDGNGSTIDFGGGAYQFNSVGTNAYSTGTLAISFGSTAVVGTGTTWTAGMVGQSILIGDYWYTISARTDNTHITLSSNYIGVTISGVTYVIATTVDNVGIKNITLTNSSATLFRFRYNNTLSMDGLITSIGNQGVDGDDAAPVNYLNSVADTCVIGVTLDNVRFFVLDNSVATSITGGNGFDLTNVSNTAMNVSGVQAITGVGFKFTNCSNLGFINYSIIECTSHGIEFASGNSDIDCDSGYINTCGGDGIKLTATSDRIEIITNNLLNCTGYGINIAASSCDNNIINANTFTNNTAGNLNDSGTATIAKANQGVSDIPAASTVAVYQQELPIYAGTGTTPTTLRTTSTTDGTEYFTAFLSTTGIITILRFAKDTNSGQYQETHSTTYDNSGVANINAFAVCIIGIYLYLSFRDASGFTKIERYAHADLTGVTNMTISGTAWNDGNSMTTEGTNLYISDTNVASSFIKYTISGTTATNNSTVTFTSSSGGNMLASIYDGINIFIYANSANVVTIRKYATSGGAVVSSSTYPYINSYPRAGSEQLSIFKAGVLGITINFSVETNTAQTGFVVNIRPISTP